jgi:putative transposase
MILTQIFKSKIPKSMADELNQESARIYNKVLVTHWRIYRKKSIWLSQYGAMALNDYLSGSTILHAHSRDAAQEAFYKACKTTRTLKQMGYTEARYPYKCRRFRTTYWKNTAVRVQDGHLLLARARGLEPVRVKLPHHLANFEQHQFKEVKLVFNHKKKRYDWHMAIDDGQDAPPSKGDNVVAIDLGEIHPAVVSDQEQAVVFSCRELRAIKQYRNKRLAQLQREQSRLNKHSNRWYRLQRRKNRFRAETERQITDIEHKISRAVVKWAAKREAATIVIGDVRDIADGKKLHPKSQQKVSQWSHGKLRQYITYKAARIGIAVELEDEAYTSQTCPGCGEKNKPSGRVYKCKFCDFVGVRDVVGSANILSKNLFGQLGQIYPNEIKYLKPFNKKSNGLSSPQGTGEMARFGEKPRDF